MWKFLHSSVHDTTARICKDTIPPADDLELKEPDPFRRCARLVAIGVAGVFLVVAVVVMAVRSPKFQSEKEGVPSEEKAAQLLRHAVQKNQIINCPCQHQVMSWCNMTTFHLIRGAKGASTFMKVRNFTKEAGGDAINFICNNTKNPLKGTICKQILSPVLNSEDTRTFLPTASAFTAPELLYKEIATRIDTNAYEQSNAFFFLDVVNKTAGFRYSQGLTHLVRQMLSQFQKKSFSSLEDYWNASKDIRKDYNLSFSYGMDVSWEMYLQTCKPAFCDIEYAVSPLNRALRAMAQVGGTTTVFTLAVRFIIWPPLRFALRFPTSK